MIDTNNSTDDSSSTSVQVAVRVRPMLASETGSTQCIEVLRQQGDDNTSSSTTTSIVRIGGASGPTFAFDEAFSNTTTQYDVFQRRVSPLLSACLEGYNATVLAYGQTGSGKTYTIMGDDANNGVIPRALRSLFQQLESIKQVRVGNKENCEPSNNEDSDDSDDMASSLSYNYEVRVQFLELYGEEIRDLLTTTSHQSANNNKLTIRDVGMDEPEVLGASQQKVHSAEEALLCLTRGMLRRVTGATAMNASSSRSHAILSVLVEQTSTLQEEEGQESLVQQPRVEVKRSKFSFVDLAGSERQKRTQAVGQRLKEGIDINKGLLVLGNVISALGDPKKMGKTFVPYRDSKLTRLLKGSLGGNHKTLMIACVSPSSSNLEESLNCLRYANRAKNIQNNAIVNVDAGSRLVAELRSQIKMLATELLCVREGRQSEATLTMDMLKTLASGGEANLPTSPRVAFQGTPRTTAVACTAALHSASTDRIKQIEEDRNLLESKLRLAESEKASTAEALHATKAEREMYRLQLEMTTDGQSGGSDDKEATFLKRATAYEQEIAALKDSLRTAKAHIEIQAGASTPKRDREQSLSVIDKANLVLSEEKAQLVSLQKKLAQSPVRSLSKELASVRVSEADQLEAEENAEREELSAITRKFLPDEGDIDEAEDAEPEDESEGPTLLDEEETEASMRLRQQMEAQLYEISRSIEAKEELIEQLQISQEKYAAMREFYEEKLQQMEEQVKARESEREQMVHELSRMEESNSCTKDLQARLIAKEEHIAGLRKKQRELVSLTKVSSRNESEIARLRNDVVSMKQKKVDLQKLVTNERKLHANEIRRLKKEAMQHDREATKWKRVSQQKAAEAEKAQKVAKSRLEQVGQLRAKYKEAEKKLRVKTVKQGVMKKAGLDPVLVGRTTRRKNGEAQVNHDAMRDLFDEKVAEVGRKEVLADKLAHEWEEHLELVSQKEELVTLSRDSRTESLSDAVDALDVQVKYKEERIRQLSRRLGKSPTTVPAPVPDSVEISFLDEDSFKAICQDQSPLVATREAAKVLFGMIVRERRRAAALARTASSLDEKVLEAEREAASKDAAFRSHVEEARREREELEQSHQERLLSLMEMVKEEVEQRAVSPGGTESDAEPEETGNEPGGPAFRTRSRAKVLLLANERIAILERQVEELKGEKATGAMYKSKEEETRALLVTKEAECEDLEKQLDRLRTSLRQIRETSTRRSPVPPKSSLAYVPSDEDEKSKEIFSIAMDALHPPRRSPSRQVRKKKGQSSGSGSGSDSRPPLLSPRLKRHVEMMHTSDSEEDEDVPEWAGDIMADLEIIAKGEAPPAILDSPGMKEMSECGSVARPKASSGAAGSVFDRLTHPDNFTGVQKQRTARQKRIKSAPVPKTTQPGADVAPVKSAKVISSQTGGDKGRRQAISRLVTEQLDNIVAPEATGGGSTNLDVSTYSSFVSPTEGRQTDASFGTSQRRSVFDRLLSPSNYTGTQKERLQRTRKKKRPSAAATEGEPEELLDELLGSDTEATDKVSPMATEDIVPSESPTSARPAKKVADYTTQDVFERLQTTTTQSYAVKQHAPAARFPSDTRQSSATHEEDIASPRHSADVSVSSPPTVGGAVSDYTKQDVFERLQKTTTQAYAKRTSKVSNDDQ